MGAADVFGMFDKLDDIVYRPVDAITNWVEEPLNRWKHKRNMDTASQDAQREENMRRLENQMEMEREQQAAELEHQRHLWDVEINAMIEEQEDAHQQKLVEAIKNYRIELGNATREITESVGMMSLNLRNKANELVIEKTREYKKIQDAAKAESYAALKEAKEDFMESDPETYRMLVHDIMEERAVMVETAGNCIKELSEDLKQLNKNMDVLMQQGMNAIQGFLEPMNKKIVKAVESKEINMIEEKMIDASYTEI